MCGGKIVEVINIREAKIHLSRIIDRVRRGESVVIGKSGKPVAVLSPYPAPISKRRPGTLKGKITIASDFDVDDEAVADLFEDSTN